MPKIQKIGLLTATSLVVGNMIGVGIFVLPAALANYGSISLLGWIFSAAGALVLAKIFSNFSKLVINKSGGPYAFAQAGFGDFIGFLVAWGYWICIWVSNGAIAIAIVGALSFFFPVLVSNSLAQILIALGMIWTLTFINSKGVRASGRFQLLTTILKLLPLGFVIIVGLFFFRIENFPSLNLSGENEFNALAAVATITLYAFLGIESATVPAENVENPEKTISRATMIGTTLVAIVYILSTIVLFGILPNDKLQSSAAPFAEAASLMSGNWAGYFVAAGVVISGIGVLNGWILIMGQVPMATAKDKLFPRIFRKENKYGSPIFGLVIGSLLSSGVMLMNYTKGLVEQFQFIVEISVFTTLVPYLFVAASYLLVVLKVNPKGKLKPPILILGFVGIAFSLWALYGSGRDTVFYGFLLLMLGIPFYILMKLKKYK